MRVIIEDIISFNRLEVGEVIKRSGIIDRLSKRGGNSRSCRKEQQDKERINVHLGDRHNGKKKMVIVIIIDK